MHAANKAHKTTIITRALHGCDSYAAEGFMQPLKCSSSMGKENERETAHTSKKIPHIANG